MKNLIKNFKFSKEDKDKETDNDKDISNKEEFVVKTSKINDDELIPKPEIRKDESLKI